MGAGETKAEPGGRRDRFSRFCEGILRINSSLELDDVLAEAADCARALAGARYGVIVTADASGMPVDFVTSGLTAAEKRQLMGWMPDGLRLFQHLRELDGPIRLTDLPGYVHSCGLAENRALGTTFLGTPMRRHGSHVGNFFLADKDDGRAFTEEDEEMLTLLAAQAAAAIVNARAHCAERRARANLQLLLDTTPVGVVLVNAAGDVPVSLNPEALRIARALRPPDMAPGTLVRDIVCRRSDGREFRLAEFPRQLAGAGILHTEELGLSVAGGPGVNVLVNAATVRLDGDETASAMLTMQDMTPFEQFDLMRTRFMSMVSHELREPLSAIKGAAATLQEEADGLDRAEMRAFFRIIAEQAGRMRSLVGDLLDAGRIETGMLAVTPERSDIGDLLERARDTFANGGNGHSIRIDLASGIAPVMADRGRIVQVLGNLLSNAAKHAPEASPIRVAAAPDGGYVAVSVSDEGAGIAPELLPELFRERAGPARTSTSGAGLGLAICKGLVEAHGGRIGAKSPGPGLGATFTFTIPVAATPESPAGEPAQEGAGRRDPARVLVVDDDPQALRFIRSTLEAAGHATLVTGDHRDLPRILRTEKPQLVLLDLALPGADGVDLLHRLPGLADVPVIFISGYGHGDTVARALDAGGEDYIVKPCSPSELTARVRLALRRHAGPRTFELGGLAIDYGTRRVSVAGRAVDLTATEYEILRLLSLSAGEVVTYDTMLRRIWSRREGADANLVRMFVSSLRRKIGDDAAKPVWIANERAVGYRMAKPADD